MARARRAMSLYAESEDLVRIGAYRQGTDPQTDLAISFAPMAEEFLGQNVTAASSSTESFAQLYGLLAEAGYQIPPEELAGA